MPRNKKILFIIFKRLSILFFLILAVCIIYKYFYKSYNAELKFNSTNNIERINNDENIKKHHEGSQLENNDNDINHIKIKLEEIYKIKNNITLLQASFDKYKQEKNISIEELHEKIKFLQRYITQLQSNYDILNYKLDSVLKHYNPQPNIVSKYDFYFGGLCFFFYLALLIPQTVTKYLYSKVSNLPFIGESFNRAIIVSHLQNNVDGKLGTEYLVNDNNINKDTNGSKFNNLTWLDAHLFLVQTGKVFSLSPFILVNSYDKYSSQKKLVGNYSRLEVGCFPLRWIWRPLQYFSFLKFKVSIIDDVFKYLMDIVSMSFGLGILLIKHNRNYRNVDSHNQQLYNDRNVDSHNQQLYNYNIMPKSLNGSIQKFDRSSSDTDLLNDKSMRNFLNNNSNKKTKKNIKQNNNIISNTSLSNSLLQDLTKGNNENPDFVCDFLLHIGVNIQFLSIMLSFYLNFKLKEIFSYLLQCSKDGNKDDKIRGTSRYCGTFIERYCMSNVMCISINLSKIFF